MVVGVVDIGDRKTAVEEGYNTGGAVGVGYRNIMNIMNNYKF